MDELLELLFKGLILNETEKFIGDFKSKNIIDGEKEIEIEKYDDTLIISIISDLGRYDKYRFVFDPKGEVDINFLIHMLKDMGYDFFSVELEGNKMTLNIEVY